FTKQTFDELLIGYDGINADTAITLAEGQTTVLDIKLSGDYVGFITGDCSYSFKINFGREVGETNQEAILRLVERIKEQEFPQGVSILDAVEVTPIDSSRGGLQGTSWVFSNLMVADSGDSNALGEVQAQYPAHNVVRTDRNNGVS